MPAYICIYFKNNHVPPNHSFEYVDATGCIIKDHSKIWFCEGFKVTDIQNHVKEVEEHLQEDQCSIKREYNTAIKKWAKDCRVWECKLVKTAAKYEGIIWPLSTDPSSISIMS
jgi:hypothetical protein